VVVLGEMMEGRNRCYVPGIFRNFTGNTGTGSGTAPPGGGAIYVEFWGNLRLDTPDSNTYSGNEPNDIFYTVPPT